eukprot:6297033-Pyramimonas_sp.AAC.1
MKHAKPACRPSPRRPRTPERPRCRQLGKRRGQRCHAEDWDESPQHDFPGRRPGPRAAITQPRTVRARRRRSRARTVAHSTAAKGKTKAA